MATQPTQNAVPSESSRDLKFNAGKIDEFVTSLEQQYIDRLGKGHYTIEGVRHIAQQAIAEFGYITVDSFQDGATLTLPNQVLRDAVTGEYYRWDGDFPKVVVAGSSPASAGGVGAGAWISVGDAALRGSFRGTLSDVITWVTPEQFGAVGDGVEDDTLAIQAAIDHIYSQGGGDVVLGPKEYRADNLVIKDFVRIKGQSIINSRIKARDGWAGLAVISTENFDSFRAAGIYGGGSVKGTWGAVIENVAIDANYQSFAGTAGISSGNGVLMAGWSNYVANIDIKWVPAVGFVKLSKMSIPTDYPSNKTDYTVYECHNISIMYCGNDAMVTADHDQVYNNILIGLYAYDLVTGGASLSGPAFYDSSRRCTGWYVRNVADCDQVHIYGCYVGHGLVVGDTDDTLFPTRFQYGRIIIESVMQAAWFRATSYCMGGEIDCHDISQNIAIPSMASYDPYPPAVLIESGLYTSNSTRRLPSDFGL